MTENSTRPIILVDMAKNRLRIHRSTLAAIGKPEFILIIVNPDARTIGVMPCDNRNPGAHRVKTQSVLGKNCFELYSASFTRKLREVRPDWLAAGKYKMEGDLIPGESVARFYMDTATFTGTGKVR